VSKTGRYVFLGYLFIYVCLFIKIYDFIVCITYQKKAVRLKLRDFFHYSISKKNLFSLVGFILRIISRLSEPA